MLELFLLTTYLLFGGRVFQQAVGIPMGTNCAVILVSLFIRERFLPWLLTRRNESDPLITRSAI